MIHEVNNQPGPAIDSKDFAIGILSITATILFVGVILIAVQPEPVLASGMSASGGDYVMTVGQAASVDEEYVYVLDSPAEKMIVYRFHPGTQQVECARRSRPEPGRWPWLSRSAGRTES